MPSAARCINTFCVTRDSLEIITLMRLTVMLLETHSGPYIAEGQGGQLPPPGKLNVFLF